MQIVMLGHTNAGKTSYMSAMYRVMATDGVAGFRVRAKTEQDHRKLLLSGGNLLHGRYPPPTDVRTTYPLSLRHSASPLIDFEWKDYRGGALRDRAAAADTSSLLADLGSADAIVLFLDSLDLQRSHVVKQRIRNMTTLVFRALESRNRPTPIVITLTKVDLLDVSENVELLEPFEPFITAVNRQESLIGTIVQVACGPRPQNVITPVLFCLYFGLEARVDALHQSVLSAQAEGDRHHAQNTFGHRLKVLLSGGTRKSDLANLAYAEALRQYQTLEPLLGPLERLHQMLGHIRIF